MTRDGAQSAVGETGVGDGSFQGDLTALSRAGQASRAGADDFLYWMRETCRMGIT